MPFFDTHAHLDDEQLATRVEDVVQQAEAADLVGITAIGTTVSSSQQCVALAKRFQSVYSSVGIHPNHCQDADEAAWSQILELAQHRDVVAIGETGLDRYWDYCPLEIQKNWFAKHIALSFDTGKPLVIHMRDCELDILEMLEKYHQNDQIIGIMHSFTGSWETAQQCLAWGMYISFAGMVTFKKSNELREIAARIPDDRLLIETDSPYLSPHPHRGQRPNQPALVRHTAQCLADVRGVSLAELGIVTTQNAQRVFQLAL
jgi:TatD DNase family protein